MARVLGVGGVFFRSGDPGRLREWYRKWLGIESNGDGGAMFFPSDMPPESLTVWSPFPATTDYFGPSGQTFMVNLIVDDLDAALAQVRQGGAEVLDQTESYDYGRFGWFTDPDGHRIELWQPKTPA
jgi:catechol 2,3-dioxygenase-like lactoylglutathione lyase family enzyme